MDFAQAGGADLTKGSVAWLDGGSLLANRRGGFNAARGRQSPIEAHPIVALHRASRIKLVDVLPSITKHQLFRRDRITCSCCGQCFAEHHLQREPILPEVSSGRWTKCSTV